MCGCTKNRTTKKGDEKSDEFSSGHRYGADGVVRRGQGAVNMTELIIEAIIEALKADGYEAEVVK